MAYSTFYIVVLFREHKTDIPRKNPLYIHSYRKPQRVNNNEQKNTVNILQPGHYAENVHICTYIHT